MAMSVEQISLAAFESLRRAQTIRLRTRWNKKADKQTTFESKYEPMEVAAEEHEDIEATPMRSRYEEIKAYLFKNRQHLALDTMNFAISGS